MKILKILVDMDNVLNNLSANVVTFLQKDYKVNLNNQLKWDFTNYLPQFTKSKVSRIINKILGKKLFWKSIPMKKNADKIMEKLCNAHDVFIVTALWDNYAGCVKDKYNWLIKNLPFFDLNKVIFESEKWLLPGDVIIDDKPKILEKFKGITITFDYPYNKNIQTTHRVKNWLEIKKILL